MSASEVNDGGLFTSPRWPRLRTGITGTPSKPGVIHSASNTKHCDANAERVADPAKIAVPEEEDRSTADSFAMPSAIAGAAPPASPPPRDADSR